ncbi:hypothetical protein EGM51_14255 [Verrucomicrobia bacterium S94]|nr:hypothetical protein EGM51_14255 [Verrucomicrobia bacterium S94]
MNNVSGQQGGGGFRGEYYNCTIVSNRTTSSYSGGGVYDATVRNSIVYGNFYNTITPDDLTSVSAYNTCSPDVTHGSDGNITNTPVFINPAAGDYRLSAGSPCIDVGSNAYVMVAVDLNGNSRIVGTSVDMGAYEYAVSSDTDGDGVDDADELIAGTDINDPLDYFHISSASNFASGTILSWDAVSNRLYSVYWTDDLAGTPFVELTNGLTEGNFEDTAGAGYTNGFYMIKVELAP